MYGAPFLSENDGLETLSSEHRFLQMFDCLNYCAQQRPDASANVPVITSLVRQAHRIYLRQAAGRANRLRFTFAARHASCTRGGTARAPTLRVYCARSAIQGDA